MGPMYEMIRMADLDRPCLHLVYEWWDVMIEKVKSAIFDPKFANIIMEHCEVSRFYDVVYSRTKISGFEEISKVQKMEISMEISRKYR